jgi:hypothetical protein
VEGEAGQPPPSVEEETGGPDLPEPKGVTPEKTTGIKRATVAKELESMGVPLPEKGERRRFEKLHAEAKETLSKKPDAAQLLVDELEREPRSVEDSESALLTFEANRLIVARDAAEQAYIDNPTPANDAARVKAYENYKRAADVFDKVGTTKVARSTLRDDAEAGLLAGGNRRSIEAEKGGAKLTKEDRAEIKAPRATHGEVKAYGRAEDSLEVKQSGARSRGCAPASQEGSQQASRRRSARPPSTRRRILPTLDEMGSIDDGANLGGVNVKAMVRRRAP